MVPYRRVVRRMVVRSLLLKCNSTVEDSSVEHRAKRVSVLARWVK